MNPIQPLLVARSLMIDASKRRCLIFCPKPPADAVVPGATIAFHDSSSHLHAMASRAGIDRICDDSDVVRFVQGGVVKTFRCSAQTVGKSVRNANRSSRKTSPSVLAEVRRTRVTSDWLHLLFPCVLLLGQRLLAWKSRGLYVASSG